MKTVTKKILPQWFGEIVSGKKKFELRLADFDLEVGDTLRLEEWVEVDDIRKPTGRFIEKTVNYIRKIDLNEWIQNQPEIIEKGMFVIQFD